MDKLLTAVLALAAAARQSPMDDKGTAFVLEHLSQTLKAMGEVNERIVSLEREIIVLKQKG